MKSLEIKCQNIKRDLAKIAHHYKVTKKYIKKMSKTDKGKFKKSAAVSLGLMKTKKPYHELHSDVYGTLRIVIHRV